MSILCALCVFAVVSAMAADYPDFNEASVTQRTEEVIKERSKDGVFVFHDPKLDADLIDEDVAGIAKELIVVHSGARGKRLRAWRR